MSPQQKYFIFISELKLPLFSLKIMSGFIEHPDSIRNDTDSKTMGRQIMAHTRDPDFVVFFHAIQVRCFYPNAARLQFFHSTCVQTACKLISRSVRKAGIAGLYGAAGSMNTTGDDQKKLDVLSNEMMVNSLYNSRTCAILVSEENEDPIIVPEEMAGRVVRAVLAP